MPLTQQGVRNPVGWMAVTREVGINAQRLCWTAWVALAVAWVALGVYAIDHREKPLCEPRDRDVVLRLGQPNAAVEKGVVYLNYRAAKAARDAITVWLHQYSSCS